jgi:hypothetical protein
MKIQFTALLALCVFSLSAFAHDPSLHHKKTAATPDCAQMNAADMSKMDPNDPVMKALHAKCASADPQDAKKHDDMKGMDMKDMPSHHHQAATTPQAGEQH